MCKMKIGTYKIDGRFNQPLAFMGSDPRVKAKLRRTKINRRPSKTYKIKCFLFLMFFLGTSYMCYVNANTITAKSENKIETEEPNSTPPLNGATSFESADMPRDTVSREIDPFDRYFGDKADQARQVAKCESSMNEKAVSKTSDYGIMQINYPTWGKVFNVSKEDLLNKETNVKLAKQIYDRSGNFGAWYMSKKCHKLN